MRGTQPRGASLYRAPRSTSLRIPIAIREGSHDRPYEQIHCPHCRAREPHDSNDDTAFGARVNEYREKERREEQNGKCIQAE
jgi:hypothetical protein